VGQIFRHADFKEIEKGTTIFREGEVGDLTYIILSGTVSVYKYSEEFGGRELVVNTLGDGQQFGELSIIAQPGVD
jgi:CRP-like cAMP-binding protein